MGQILQRYHVAFLTLLLTASLAHWPTILNPLAQAYIRLCSHSLRHLPLFLQHYPPYVVATLLVGLVVLLGSAFVLLARQLVRQYRVAAGLNALQQPVHGSGATIADSCGIGNRLRVIQDQSVFAFCLGLVSPRIYVSEGLLQLLDAHELAAVLHHEAAHLRGRDPLRLFLSELLGYLGHPLPALQTLTTRIRIQIELAADQAALAVVPVEVLASALLKVGQASAPVSLRLAVAGLSPTEARIAALIGLPSRLSILVWEC